MTNSCYYYSIVVFLRVCIFMYVDPFVLLQMGVEDKINTSSSNKRKSKE